MSKKRNNIWIQVGIILFFLAVSCVYFSPILGGKVLPQGDIQKYEGMAKAQKDYHNATGDYANWAPSMFSGMPGYQITRSPQRSVFTPVDDVATLSFIGRGNDIGVMFLYLVGFYVALLALGVSPLLAILGALAFGLGSYNIIIIEAGHITKARALAMMAPILAGMILTFRKRYVLGGILFTVALGMQISLNHIQITFYTVLAALILGVVYLVFSIKDKRFKSFLNAVLVLLIGCGLAFACNLRHLLVNQEYMKYTMRGGKEITVTPHDLHPDTPETSDGTTAKGLDLNYAFGWSYGVGETYTLLVPGAYGGGSGEKVSTNSAFYKNFHQEQAPLYWGNQPFTSGPVYFGAIVIFLFIMGLIVVKGPERWWLLLATILAIIMSWGNNALGINGWLFEHLPLYNKFRTPSMSLVLANVTMVLMAVLALKSIIDNHQSASLKPVRNSKTSQVNPSDAAITKRYNRALYISAGITCGILLIGIFLAGGFSYSGTGDAQMAQQYADQPQLLQMLQQALSQDRESLFRSDSWRSLLFVLLAAVTLWLYINNKIKKNAVAVAAMAVFIVFDLWGVDRRYLSASNFTEESRIKMTPEQYDLDIDQQAAQHGDVYYRVFDLATDTYNDSKPSAFHHQIGGYSAAKLRRYQDIIDFYINGNAIINHYNKSFTFDSIPVLDMLNARYIVLPTQGGTQVIRRNTALGNAWFVDSCRVVNGANAEILALNNFNPATTAIVAKEDADKAAQLMASRTPAQPADSGNVTAANGSTIVMANDNPFNPDHATYKVHCTKTEMAVFSEIYYKPDWFAYIDGKPAQYFHANYVLRAMIIPVGDHIVEFRNEAPTLHKLDTWTLIGSIATLLLIAGTIFVSCRKKTKAEIEAEKSKENNK